LPEPHPSPSRPVRARTPTPSASPAGRASTATRPGPLADVLTEEPDFVVLEALAELTLSILAKDRERDETLGYTRDLPLYLLELLPAVLEGRTRSSRTPGGINPLAAARMVTERGGALRADRVHRRDGARRRPARPP
jgi:hypothetical protein